MKELTRNKYHHLLDLLRGLGSVAVAFSGGADSALLLIAAQEALGDRAVAVTAVSETFPSGERKEAESFCREHGIHQLTVETGEMQLPEYRSNPVDRCYLCKHTLYGEMLRLAREQGIETVVDGSNADDAFDYRPGMNAVREYGIHSPLMEAELTKAEIREISREKGLSTAEKPSYACLASRFVYGEEITEAKLRRVDQAENLLRRLGLGQLRVRIHGPLARIEVTPEVFPVVLKHRGQITASFREFGFRYVTLDLEGYRTGSMNEVLPSAPQQDS